MKNAILFKNGELEVMKTLAEVMKEARSNKSRKAIIPSANYSKGVFTLKSLDCNFHFLKDCTEYARLLECAYFMGSMKSMTAEESKLEESKLEEGLTEEQEEKLAEISETLDIFESVLSDCYTEEEKTFCQADKLIKFMAVYFSKDISCLSNLVGFITFFNNLTEDKPTQTLKPLLEKVLSSFSIEKEDAIYLPYHFHANTTLVEDCKKVYYKGRKVSKSKVVKTYDKDGKATKLEIVLAVIEDLQRRSRKAYEEDEKKYQAEEAKKKEATSALIKKAEAEAIAKAEAKAKKVKEEAEAKKK